MKNKTTVVCGFPGIGKSFLFYNKISLIPKSHQQTQIYDSDSSKFSWISEGIRHPDFPNNYVQYIKTLNGIVFCSTHENVRQSLADNHINYIIVYPSIDCKDEYIQRYIKRSSPPAFIRLLDENYYQWVNDLENTCHANCLKVELSSGKTLTDAYMQVIYGLHNDFCMPMPINNKYTI